MRVSSADDRQTVDLQRDALVAAGVDHRHFHTDKASDARDDRPGLKAGLDYLNAGDTLIVWTLNRLGRPLPHLLSIVTDLKARGITFRSLTEQMNTTTSHGELLLSLFGARAQYDRALMRERVMVGLAAAKRRERQGGRPPMINTEIPERIAAGTGRWGQQGVCLPDLKIPRSTLINALARIGWTTPAKAWTRSHQTDCRQNTTLSRRGSAWSLILGHLP